MDNIDGEVPGAQDNAAGRGGIIGARGTADGLIIRIDGRIDEESLKRAVTEFVSSRERFLSGHDVLIEWVGEKPVQNLDDEICDLLKSGFNISVKSSSLKSSALKKPGVSRRQEAQAEKPLQIEKEEIPDIPLDFCAEEPRDQAGLFGGIEGLPDSNQGISRRGSVDANLWDDPDARIISSMLRSGQRIETEHSLVVFGDVNSGAELIAGGDIVVLGTLRGVAHAGAYEESGGGRTIFALNLQPTQLRIGSIISRGTGENKQESRQKGAEVAHVDKDFIVVEPYSAKSFLSRKRDQ